MSYLRTLFQDFPSSLLDSNASGGSKNVMCHFEFIANGHALYKLKIDTINAIYIEMYLTLLCCVMTFNKCKTKMTMFVLKRA